MTFQVQLKVSFIKYSCKIKMLQEWSVIRFPILLAVCNAAFWRTYRGADPRRIYPPNNLVASPPIINSRIGLKWPKISHFAPFLVEKSVSLKKVFALRRSCFPLLQSWNWGRNELKLQIIPQCSFFKINLAPLRANYVKFSNIEGQACF